MDENQRELVDYFIEQTNQRFEKLEHKVDKLLEFKWQIVGGSVGLSAVLTLAIQIIFGK
jgi:hypothetical protein